MTWKVFLNNFVAYLYCVYVGSDVTGHVTYQDGWVSQSDGGWHGTELMSLGHWRVGKHPHGSLSPRTQENKNAN